MSAHQSTQSDFRGRDRLAKILMIALGLATVGAFVNAVVQFGATPSDQVIVETWRMLAYPVFAGLFIVLGLFPRRVPGLWELVFFQKAGVAIFLAFFVKGAVGAATTDVPSIIIAVDGTLAIVTLISYALSEGWRAWTSVSPRG